MPDVGHKMTDEMLADLEKKINSTYSQASNEMLEKLNKKLEKYEKNLTVKQQQFDSGQISKKEFENWKKNQAAAIRNVENLQRTLADDLVNTDQIAVAMINGHTPSVYALNYNYGTYQIESDIKASTSFALYNHFTVENLLKDNPKLLPKPKVNIPKDKAWSYKHINNAITQGILQGESIPNIAKRLKESVGMNKNAAVRNARTAVTGAQNSGRNGAYQRAKDKGIPVSQKWLATLDGRTRHSHRQLDGEIQPLDGMFSNGCRFPGDPEGPGYEVYNCFIPETNVAVDSEIIRSYKHHYEGKIVSIKSARGISFTCTPNHPILTDRGWVAAKFLKNRDHLIVTNGINNEVSRRNPNINHRFPRFDTIHKLFNEFGTKRTCDLGVNFHGDIPTSDVEIITEKGFLWNNRDSGCGEGVNKLLLKDTNSSLMRKGSFMKHLGGIVRTTLSDICSISKTLFIFFRSLRHSIIHRFRSISNGNIVFSKNPIDNLSADSVFNGESLIGLTGKVFIDDIIDIEFGMYSGHVYNLQTENNYYFINNIISQNNKKCNDIFAIAHNCRCTLVPVIKGFERDDSWKQENFDYENWKKGGKGFTDWLEDQAAPDDEIMNLWGDMKMSQMYNMIKAESVSDANKFYKELGKLGKPSEVWNKYLTGQLDSDELENLEGILKEYLPKPIANDNPFAGKTWYDLIDLPELQPGQPALKYLLDTKDTGWSDYLEAWANGKVKDSKLDELLLGKKAVDKIDDVSDATKIAKEAQDQLDKLKIKAGKAMTKDEADTYKVNPLYNATDKTTTTNCQTCSYAYELRRQGYDVTALPKDPTKKDIYDLQVLLGKDQANGWVNKTTGQPPKSLWAGNHNMYENLEKTIGHNGERYTLSYKWENKTKGTYGGHVVNIDRTPDGMIRIIDNQRGSGQINTWIGKDVEDYFKTKNITQIKSIYRVDDCVPNAKYFNKIVKVADKTDDVKDIAKPAIKVKSNIDFNALKAKKVTQIYNEIKADKSGTEANKFYNELKAIGKKDGLKQGDVWKKYLAGELDADDVAKVEKYLGKYKAADKVDDLAEIKKALPDKMTGLDLDQFDEAKKIIKNYYNSPDAGQIQAHYSQWKKGLLEDDNLDALFSGKKVATKIPDLPEFIDPNTGEILDAVKEFEKIKKMPITDLDDMAEKITKKYFAISKETAKDILNKTGLDIPEKKVTGTSIDLAEFKKTMPQKFGDLYDEFPNQYDDIHEIVSSKKSAGSFTDYWQKYINGDIKDDDLDKIFEKVAGVNNSPKQTSVLSTPKFDFDAVKGKKMSAVYNDIKSTDTKTANQFYNELKKMGKPSEVWDDYVNGAISADKQKKIEDILIKKYVKGGTTVKTASNVSAAKTTKTVNDLAKLAKDDKDLYDDIFDALHDVKGSPGTNWKKYLAGEIDNPELDKILVKHNIASDDIVKKVENQKKLEKAQDELKAAEKTLNDNVDVNAKWHGIWKDDVTVEDYAAKKSTIASKKQWYQDKIEELEHAIDDPDSWNYKSLGGSDGINDKIQELETYLEDLDEFEELGKKYEKYKKAVNDAREKVQSLTPAGEMYTQTRKDAAKWYTKSQYKTGDKWYDSWSRSIHKNATTSEHSAYMRYTSASGGFNRPLAGFKSPAGSGSSGWTEKYFKGVGKVPLDNEGKGIHTKNLTTFIEKSKTPEDIWIQTAQNYATLEGPGGKGFLPGVDYNTLSKMSDAELQQFVGVESKFGQFISGSINRGGGSYTPGDVRINIYCPKGSEALYVLEDGIFGKAEHEIILQRGGTYRVTKIYWGNDVEEGGRKLMVDLELRLEKGYDKYGQ